MTPATTSGRAHRPAGGCLGKLDSLTHRESPMGSMASRSLLILISTFIAAALVGCSSTPRPQLGQISVTDPSGVVHGQLNSVTVNATVAVSVGVNQDQTNLGVDWSLTCLGSSVVTYTTNVCGILNPVHVGSNINMLFTAPAYVPVGNTVTLTATVTSDPSESSSITLTIDPQPITIQFTTNLPPATMGLSGTAQIAATVTNDPIAAGVNWKAVCGETPCGSLNPELTASGNPTVYTAPADLPPGGTVTITATSVKDPTKSVSAKITILPVSIAVSPESITIAAHGMGDLTANVVNDAFNKGVDWDAPVCSTAGECGSVSPTHTASGVATTYTAPATVPAGGKVTVTARSTTNPKVAATVRITIATPPPIIVTVTPPVSYTQLQGTATLVANVVNDYTNSGVNWQCDPGSCSPSSSLTQPFQTVFTAPTMAPPNNAITVKAISIYDATRSGSATVKILPTISVKINTSPPVVTAGVPAQFSATVANDIASGGVDWSASNCGVLNCGTFNSGDAKTPNHSASGANISYIAPVELPATTVTITATSTASETYTPVQSASTSTSVTPVTYVRFIPFGPSALPVANPASPILISMVAVAANDSSNEGIDWAVCSAPSTCGAFLVAPAIPATATTQAVPPVYSATFHAASGQTVSYLPPTEVPGGGKVILKITATDDKTATMSQPVEITNNTSAVAGVALQGYVQAGTLPVSGASVQLFAAGSTGYGSASSPLVISDGGTTVTTGTDGSFSIPAGYTCPAQNTELYLIALGGAPGNAKNNPQLGLMTALGPCSNLNSATPVFVNEITTVASTWALVPFTGADYAHIGSSGSNYATGFASAFATVNNLVDITTGKALPVTPAGYGTVPIAEISTLADAIDSCAATAGGAAGDGSPCGNFFEATDVSPQCGGVACPPPTSILQAVLEQAVYPSNLFSTPTAGSSLYNIVSAMVNPPFLPILTAAPNDWSIAISFTGGGLGGSGQASPQSTAMAIDAQGNVWISNRKTSSVSELSNLGAPLSPFGTGTTSTTSGGFTGAGLTFPKKVAIDIEGNAWILNVDSSLSELDFNGKPVKGSPFSGGGTATATGMAIDGSGFVWLADSGPPGDVAKYAGFNALVNGKPVANGKPVSPAGGYVHGINAPNGAIAIDGSGTVWILNEGNFAAAELNGTSGGLIQTDYGYLANPQTGVPIMPLESVFSSGAFGDSMAIDNAGDVYVPNSNTSGVAQIYELLAGGSAANDGGIGQSLSLAVPPVGAAIAIDGSGHLWQVTFANSSNGEPPALTELSSSGASLNLNLSAPGFVGPNIVNGATSIAVDGSGNVWVLIDTSSSTVTEFVGVAAPVVTPLALGVQTKSLGKKP